MPRPHHGVAVRGSSTPHPVSERNVWSMTRRTTGQIALDAFVELVKLGVAGDSSHVVGTHKPTVRLHVTDG